MQRDELPESCSDENVFDIQQGVAISIFSPRTNQDDWDICYADLIGTRADKYARLLSGRLPEKIELHPQSPYFFFKPKGFKDEAAYLSGFALNKVFINYSSGIKFRKDNLLVKKHFTRDSVEEMLRDVARLSDADLLAKYEVDETPDWKLKDKRQLFAKWKPDDIVKVMYRALDFRYAFYPLDRANQIIVRGDSRVELMRSVLRHKNIGLQFNRQIVGDSVSHFLASCVPTSQGTFYLGNKGQDYFAPLYLYHDDSQRKNLLSASRAQVNLTPDFLVAIAGALRLKSDDDGLPVGISPEDIFHYIYAVFHSPCYRSRYAEFLKIDFPRLPLTSSLELFRELARLGGELVAFHLVEAPAQQALSVRYDRAAKAWRYEVATGQRLPVTLSFNGPENPVVGKVGFHVEAASSRLDTRQDAASTLGTVWLDAPAAKKGQPATPGTIGFCGMPEAVWNFHIGGYQVCQKWLKDRKGRTLTKDDIAHYHKIVIALAETIRIMGEIDEVIDHHGGWPGAFATEPTPKSTGEGQNVPDSIGKVSGTPVSPKPPTSSAVSTAVAPSRPVAPGKPVDNEERKAILVALDKAGEALGTPLLSLKSKIERRRLEEILPVLVGQGIVRQSGTGSSARYARG